MILAVLKEQTRRQHERAERTLDLPSRLASAGHYAALLARFYGFYTPLEDRLAAVGGYAAVGLDFAARRKAHLLVADLASLGADAGALPRCADLPEVADLADALGCLYVLEGATLGGQFVRRQAEKAVGVTAARGCAFFASYGERVGAMWKAFGASLEGFAAADPGAEAQIVAAAGATFAALDRWLAGGAA